MEPIQIRVSPQGKGDCPTVERALELAAAHRGKAVTIRIGKGVYREKLVVSQDHITFQGDPAGETVLTYGDYAREPMGDGETRGTFRTATVRIDASDFTARDLVFENSAGPGAKVGQALALYVDGDRVFFDRCRILGHQDTLFTAPLPPAAIEKNGFRGPKEFAPRTMGRHYYRRCLIQGEVDFIFGGARAWFENCDLVSLETGQACNGYVTAASTPQGEKYGYVFRNCRFRGACRERSVYLGRPWREYAKVVVMHSDLGAHIRPEAWHDWNKEGAHDTAFYREYRNTGEGAAGVRAPWSGQLTDGEAREYTPEKVLGSWIRGL